MNFVIITSMRLNSGISSQSTQLNYQYLFMHVDGVTVNVIKYFQ